MVETYFTVEQIAEMLDIHPKTIQRYIREGRLRAVKIGKAWRVTGHDLSAFTENAAAGAAKQAAAEPDGIASAMASSVIDITVPSGDFAGRDEAIRIMNTLTAVLNTKPPEYGRSSMNCQYIEAERKVRVTLWGGVRFTAAMMDAIGVLTENNNEE